MSNKFQVNFKFFKIIFEIKNGLLVENNCEKNKINVEHCKEYANKKARNIKKSVFLSMALSANKNVFD
jgi:hypothetical protein